MLQRGEKGSYVAKGFVQGWRIDIRREGEEWPERIPYGVAEFMGNNVVGARLINMFEVRQNPSRAVKISRANRIDRREITTTYVP